MSKSSIEWLKDQLECFGNKHELQVSWATVDELFEQAKKMHKQEIMDAWYNGFEENRPYVDHSEDYYNETFGGKNGTK